MDDTPLTKAAAGLLEDLLGRREARRVPHEALPVGLPDVRPDQGEGERQGKGTRGNGAESLSRKRQRPDWPLGAGK